MKPGDRVRVDLDGAYGWSQGAIDSMSGKTGVVVDVRPTGLFLVRFDKPVPPPWWGGQSEPLAWHFDARELRVI